MTKNKTIDLRDITDAIEARIENESKRVLSFSARDIALEYGISIQAAADILRGLGAEYDGFRWYIPNGYDNDGE